MDPSIQEIKKINATGKETIEVNNPIGVFFGGTSGIGEGSAIAFAKHTKNATAYIIGRNAQEAERIIGTMHELQPEGKFEFLYCDLTLVRNAREISNKIKSKESKINVLVLSSGAYLSENDIMTEEDIEIRSAVFYYSRWTIIDELLPSLSKAADLGEISRINVVLSPSASTLVDQELADKMVFGSVRAMGEKLCTMNSLLMLEYEKQYPKVSFIHSDPGMVKTNLTRNMPWYFKYAFQTMCFFIGQSAEDCGERMHYLHWSESKYGPGVHLVGSKNEDARPDLVKKGHLSEESKQIAYEHTHGLIDRL